MVVPDSRSLSESVLQYNASCRCLSDRSVTCSSLLKHCFGKQNKSLVLGPKGRLTPSVTVVVLVVAPAANTHKLSLNQC